MNLGDEVAIKAETTLKAHADVVVQPNGTDTMKWYGNVNYWLQALRAIGTEYVSFAYKNSHCPALFQPVGEDHTVQHVQMPMTTRDK
jgi:DNA polymerase III sliding clamp (beta) subunit (PCNA family)